MEKLLEILSEIRPDVDFNEEKGLIDNAILDSLDIMSIVAELTDQFDIVISPADIIPTNFNSAEALWNMVQSLK